LQDTEKKIEDTTKKIDQLSMKKKEMEFLIKKASTSLYLKERYNNNNDRLIEFFNENKKIEKKLEALNEEINKIENPEILEEISKIIEKKEIEGDLLWVKPNFMGFGIDLNNIIKRLKKGFKQIKS